MLAVARIGAIHSGSGGFSPDALAGRIQDYDSLCDPADEGVRGGRAIHLNNTDAALENCPMCTTAIVVKRTDVDIDWIEGRDYWYHEEMETTSAIVLQKK